MLSTMYFVRHAVIQVGKLFENALEKLPDMPDLASKIMDQLPTLENCSEPIFDLKRANEPIEAPRLFESETSFEAGNIFQMKPGRLQKLKFCIFEILRGVPSSGILAHFPPAKAENQVDCKTSKDLISKGISHDPLKKLH